MLLDDTGGDGGMRKEGRHVKMVVTLDEDSKWGEVRTAGDTLNSHFLLRLRLFLGLWEFWDVKDLVSLHHRRGSLAIF